MTNQRCCNLRSRAANEQKRLWICCYGVVYNNCGTSCRATFVDTVARGLWDGCDNAPGDATSQYTRKLGADFAEDQPEKEAEKAALIWTAFAIRPAGLTPRFIHHAAGGRVASCAQLSWAAEKLRTPSSRALSQTTPQTTPQTTYLMTSLITTHIILLMIDFFF